MSFADSTGGERRPRAREAGIVVGVFTPGPLNAITDVEGVRVGQETIIDGDSIRTGVTAILPHGGNPYLERVPAAIHVANGFGKLVGYTQVSELGELETPILLTCTLCVWSAADAMSAWMLEKPGMEEVRSINPVVGETNDGYLNDIRARPVREMHVRRALDAARGGAVDEGAVGAGTGTRAFGWKGGIGSSSRRLPRELGGWTIGVLVQSNFGGALTINGSHVGRALGNYAYRDVVEREERGDGSIMIVVATDAPIDSRNLERLASRAIAGVVRSGGNLSNGSGDYVIAFSTHAAMRRRHAEVSTGGSELANDEMSPLFQAVAEATEEAIYNSLFRAATMKGRRGVVEALPLDSVREIIAKRANPAGD